MPGLWFQAYGSGRYPLRKTRAERETVRQSRQYSRAQRLDKDRSVTEEKRVMKVNTYVNFRGTCSEAFGYYEQQLGARIGMMMKHVQAPDQSPFGPEWKDKVMHATISIGDSELMGTDIPHAEPMRSPYLMLTMDSDSEVERVFSALADGGQVFTPIQETFFASSYGQLRDRFGINWMILHQRPMPRA
jgi:PhnB protein